MHEISTLKYEFSIIIRACTKSACCGKGHKNPPQSPFEKKGEDGPLLLQRRVGVDFLIFESSETVRNPPQILIVNTFRTRSKRFVSTAAGNKRGFQTVQSQF